MAATITIYNSFKLALMDKEIDLEADTIKVSLHTSTYTPDIDNDSTTADLSNELAASGNYSTGGESLTTLSTTQDNTDDEGVWDADDLTWTALTQSAAFRYGVIYSSTASNALIGYIDFGADQAPGGSDFLIQWAAEGILNIG